MGLQDRDYYQARQQKAQQHDAKNNDLSAYTRHYRQSPRLQTKMIIIWIGITIVLTIVGTALLDAKHRSKNTSKPVWDKTEVIRPIPTDEQRNNRSTWTI